MSVDIDDPIQVSSPKGPNSGPEPDPEQIAMLADMGFTSAQTRKALRETVCEIFLGLFLTSYALVRLVRERGTCRGVALQPPR